MNDWTAGTFAGMTSKVIEYPFDTVKVRLQTQTTNPYSISGIYRGITAPILGAMLENAVMFSTYAVSERYASSELGMSKLGSVAFAGGVSGFALSFVLSPVELLKCRMQTLSHFNSPKHVLLSTIRTGGLSSLYTGHSMTMLREVPGSALYFTGYQLACRSFAERNEDMSSIQTMVSGAIAGMFYWSAIYPIDSLKSVIQTSSSGSYIAAFRNASIVTLYRGLPITVFRSIPANAAIFIVYENTLRYLNKI